MDWIMRSHDLCLDLKEASPDDLQSGSAAWMVRAGFAESPFGTCLTGESPHGICHVSFVESMERRAGAAHILENWPLAHIEWDDSVASRLIDLLFAPPGNYGSRPRLRAFVCGSRFQVRVWRALLHIPGGTLISYGRLAAAVGNRSAARAVGTAVGRNPLAYLIPCHRVILETGELGNYRWGRERKRSIVAWERSSSTAAAGI